MAQKRTSRKKKQRVLKKKGEKTVGGVENPPNVFDDDFDLQQAQEEQRRADNDAFSEYSNTDPLAGPLTEEETKEAEDIGRDRKVKNPPKKSFLDTMKSAAANLVKPNESEKKEKKKGKVGTFEKKMAKVGEKLDKIAFDLDFDSLKSSDKAPIIKQTLIESISNKSKILNDSVQEKMNTEIGYKNANPMDVIWAETIREIEDMFAKYNKAASGKMDKDQGTKTTTVIETEVFPAQKEKIHTPLLKFLYDLILVPENDENFKKIVWSFIAKMNEKALIDKNVPSGFKDLKEITYTTTAMAGYTDTEDGQEGSKGPAMGGSKRKSHRKKQRGGTLQLDGVTVDFNSIENETLFYSLLNNDAAISTTNDFLADLQKMNTSESDFPFSLLFFDLETIEEDWLKKPESVDILLGLLKEKEKGILIADPELEFKGTGENKMVLRATFNLENGVYGIFVHNSVQELDTVLNLLDGMELVEVNEKEEEVGEVEKKEVPKEESEEVPKGAVEGASPISEEDYQKEEEKQTEKSNWELEKERAIEEGKEFDENSKEANKKRNEEEEVKTEEEEKQKAKEISDAILKTAIRLVADSLKEKATPTEKTQEISNTALKTGIKLIADSLKELPGKSELVNVESEKEPELSGNSVFVPISEETITTLTQYDPTVVPMIENIKEERKVINNYVQNNTKIFNIIESSKEPKSESSDELKKDIVDLKTQNEQISQDVTALTVLMNELITNLNSPIIPTVTNENVQTAASIQTREIDTQTPPPDDEMKKQIEAFKQKSQEQITALETKVETLQKAVLEKEFQSKITDENNKALVQENAALFGELQKLQKVKEDLKLDTSNPSSQEPLNEFKLTQTNLATLGEQKSPEKKVPPLPIKTPESNENSKPIVPFKVSETGLRVGGLKKGSHLFKDNAVFLGWDYIKGIREKYENYKEPRMYKKIISPAIISERVTMCKNLLNILDNLTDIKKIEERKKHKKNVPEIYLEHVSIIAYILNYQNLTKLPITTVTSKNSEIQKYKPFTEDNLLYYLYKKQEIPINSVITIEDLKDTTNILDFFEKVRSYLYQELKKIDDSLSAGTNYFDTTEKGKKKKSNTAKYDNLLQEIHKIIQQKQQNLKDLEDKNDENVKLINKIPHKDRNKGGEKIDIHIDTPNLEDYINEPFLIKSGQMDTNVTESPKEVLKHNYDTAIIPTNLKILDKIDTTIKLNSEGIVDYDPIDFLDLIDIKAETSVKIPIPKNKKNKTEKNTGKPSSGRQSRRSLNSDSSKAESEDQENNETYIVKPIKTDVSENVTSIINVLNKISKEDIQGLLKKESVSEIDSKNSSGRLSSNDNFVTANNRPVSGNSSNYAETIQSAQNISPGISPGISPNSSNFGTPTGTPLNTSRK